MSFSGEIKQELCEHYAKARHCNLAELSAIAHVCGEFSEDRHGECLLAFHTENLPVARKCFTLMKKTFNIDTNIVVRHNPIKDSWNYSLYFKGEELMAVKNASVQAVCCKRAYIRGAFIAAGSMSDPRKAYHFEIVCASEARAVQLQTMMDSFGVDAKIVLRKKTYVVYLKEGSQIVDLLNVMEAPVALMEFENVRILKDMRNTVNRKVNCETANINKTVSAAVKQMDDIRYIQAVIGLDGLPDNLREMALVRLERPDATLKELGEALNPPVGKSGVNHRLRKLGILADDLRERSVKQ